MKRRFIIRLGLLVLAGAIVNVAVSWGCAIFAAAGPGPMVWHVYNPNSTFVGYGSDEYLQTSGWPIQAIAWKSSKWPHQTTWTRINSTGFDRGPLCPGFAINTIFYAAILWLVFAAPFRVRRWRRIRRGLCVRCAYPVGTSAVCSECGASIPFPLRGRVREGVKRGV